MPFAHTMLVPRDVRFTTLRSVASQAGTQEPYRARSPAWPQVEVLRTRIEGLWSLRARRSLMGWTAPHKASKCR